MSTTLGNNQKKTGRSSRFSKLHYRTGRSRLLNRSLLRKARVKLNLDAHILKVIKEVGYQAANRGMETMGFIVATEGNYIVKQYADGHTEKISAIKNVQLPEKIMLD